MGGIAGSGVMGPAEQVAYLRDEKNVSFGLVSEDDAEAFLAERNYFFKLKAFAKNFEKYDCKPGEKGRYVNLDFGHLVELSKLDKAVRSLVLDLTLDIEHYLKVRINAAVMRSGSDPYGIAASFLEASSRSVVDAQAASLGETDAGALLARVAEGLASSAGTSGPEAVAAANAAVAALSEITLGRDPGHVRRGILGMRSSPYSGLLAARYSEGPLPLWALLELVSFGSLTRLYRHCFAADGVVCDAAEREAFKANCGMLRCAQQLRNAAAHNDCLLNTLARHERRSGSHGAVRRMLADRYGLPAETVAQVSSVRVAMDLAAVLALYDFYVPRGGSRRRAGGSVAATGARLQENAAWFSKSYAVSSFLAYAGQLFPAFAGLFR